MFYTTKQSTKLITDLAMAVAQRKLFEGVHNAFIFNIWYDQAIPVITVTRPEDGIVFEGHATDKPEIMSQMLAHWVK